MGGENAGPVFAGKCMGGPWNGQNYVHWADTVEFSEPALRPLSLVNMEHAYPVATHKR
jgi:hypothetical protein